MRMILKKRNHKRKILLWIILIITLIIISSLKFINYYSKKVIPILTDYAKAETKKLTILIKNKGTW